MGNGASKGLHEEGDARQVAVKVEAEAPDGVRLARAHVRSFDAVRPAGTQVVSQRGEDAAPGALADQKHARTAQGCAVIREELAEFVQLPKSSLATAQRPASRREGRDGGERRGRDVTEDGPRAFLWPAVLEQQGRSEGAAALEGTAERVIQHRLVSCLSRSANGVVRVASFFFAREGCSATARDSEAR